MRVLHVYAGPFPSHQGTQVYLRGLLGAQADRGDEVALRCWHGGVGVVPDGVDVRRLRPSAGGDRLVSGPQWSRLGLGVAMGRALGKDLDERWDIVHAHHVEAPIIARVRGARPLVHHLHTCLAQELPTYGVRGGRWVGAALDRACVRAAHGTVALSERGAALARRWGAERVTAIGPGIEPITGDAGRGRRLFGLGGEPWVAYVGNLDAYQDLEQWLVDAAAVDLPVLIVTAAPTAALERRAAEVGLRRLAIARCGDFQDQCDALSAAAIAVVPRRHCAGVPMKLLVTLALGLPTLVVKGAVDPRPGAVAIDAGDLANRAAQLLTDAPARRELAVAAAEGALRSTWAEHARQMEAFYDVVRSAVTPGTAGT